MGALNLALKLIRALEGLRLTAYWDAYGKRWTVGFGHTGPDVHEGLTITLVQALAFAARDMAPLYQLVKDRPMLEGAALISFGYNCGEGALKRVLSGEIVVNDEEFWAPESQTNHMLVVYGERSGGSLLEALQARRNLEASLIELSRSMALKAA